MKIRMKSKGQNRSSSYLHADSKRSANIAFFLIFLSTFCHLIRSARHSPGKTLSQFILLVFLCISKSTKLFLSYLWPRKILLWWNVTESYPHLVIEKWSLFHFSDFALGDSPPIFVMINHGIYFENLFQLCKAINMNGKCSSTEVSLLILHQKP